MTVATTTPIPIKVTTSALLSSTTDNASSSTPSFIKTAVATRPLPSGTLISTNPTTTPTKTKAYSSVQVSRSAHIELNSDLLYCNHSCNPNVIFDVDALDVVPSPNDGNDVALKGHLQVRTIRDVAEGEELTFFYPSTEWDMAQGFRCCCGAGEGKCLGWVGGAKDLDREVLRRFWLSRHVRELLEERDGVKL